MADEREEIARIIDPVAWETFDYLASLPNSIMDAAQRYVDHSLAKADAILARAQGPGEAVAWRVKDFADGWVLCATKAEADALSLASSGALVEALGVIAATPTREA